MQQNSIHLTGMGPDTGQIIKYIGLPDGA